MNKQENAVQPPAHLSDETKTFWREMVEQYDLKPHHLKLLLAACEAWDEYTTARTAIREKGLTFTPMRGRPMARPEVAIARDARLAFLRALRELNLPGDEVPGDPQAGFSFDE